MTWLRPQSNRLLFEGGFTVSKFTSGGWGMELDQSDFEACGFQLHDNVLINDTGLGYTYNGGGIRDIRKSHQANGRFSTSLIKAAHSLKAGMQFMYGLGGGYRTYSTRNVTQLGGLPVSYQFNNGTPTQLTQFAAPIAQVAQLNPGPRRLRAGPVADHHGTDGQRRSSASTGYAPTRRRSARRAACWSRPAASIERDNLPNWKDLSPRMGIVWDPTRSGRTAIKVGLNRYVNATAVGMANQLSPVNSAVASTTRIWTDTNANRYPDCDLRATTLERRVRRDGESELRPAPCRRRRRIRTGSPAGASAATTGSSRWPWTASSPRACPSPPATTGPGTATRSWWTTCWSARSTTTRTA